MFHSSHLQQVFQAAAILRIMTPSYDAQISFLSSEVSDAKKRRKAKNTEHSARYMEQNNGKCE